MVVVTNYDFSDTVGIKEENPLVPSRRFFLAKAASTVLIELEQRLYTCTWRSCVYMVR